ncbi:MAG TPA: flagellar basal body-associated FliL family protein [bacterium]|nr:flagellar basal body-associated FliL family protein [bacterium]
MNRTERILAVIIASLLIIIISGTSFAVLTGARSRKLARAAVPAESGQTGIFDGIGRIRAKTADKPSAVVVVDVAFPFDSADRQFREELTQRRGELRSAATAFFSGKRAEELSPANEAAVKAGLRDTLNRLLSLGRIEELYFSQFHVVQ